MKKYFVDYYRNFGNTYTLVYAETQADFDALRRHYPDAERITRKEAIEMARAEKLRRRCDPAFSGFASAVVVPASFFGDASSPWWYGMKVKDYILHRI